MSVIEIEEAAALLPAVSRVLVFGCSGSGKSTLSQKLASRFGLRYVSLDRDILWLPGWKMRDEPEQCRLMESVVGEDKWVFDGTGPRTMQTRLARAELAIWMRPSRWVSLKGILSRWLRLMGRVRPEMAPRCPEKMDLEFLAYVWNFERDQAPRVEKQIALHGENVPVLMLKSHRETARLLALLGKHS